MRVSVRRRILVCLLVTTTVSLSAQAPRTPANRPGLIALNAIAPAELREWDDRINQMLRVGEFIVSSSSIDPDIPDRTHEALTQYYRNIPVYGGSVSRQMARGASVSIIGTFFENVAVDSSVTLSASEVVLRLSESVGARLVGRAPRLVVFPTLDGRYRLAYLLTMSDTKTYVVDGESASVLLSFDEMQTQSQVGSGTGALGDAKKMSTTQVSGVFRAHDQLRPAQIRTFDTHGSDAALNRLLLPPGVAVDGDFSVDADNTWADPPVVDTHAHAGWMEDYLFKQMNWAGVDNRRSTITSAVHTGLVNNAFFISPPFGPDGGGMFVYGRTTAGAPMTTLDIVAHEMMHGVTNAALVQRTGTGLLNALFIDRLGPSTMTSGGSSFPCDSTVVVLGDGRRLPLLCAAGRYVQLSNHPGALNEGFSDVSGISAEFFYQQTGSGSLRADYKMGEDVAGVGASRAADTPASISITSSLGPMPYPDHASRAFSFLTAIAEGSRSNPIAVLPLPWVLVGDQLATLPTSDSAGVHLNATILSHAFYLAIEGGRNATSGLAVQGVGATNRVQVERAFFRAMTLMMPNVPSMSVAAQATAQAAVDLYGAASPPAVAIRQAMQAVGLMN